MPLEEGNRTRRRARKCKHVCVCVCARVEGDPARTRACVHTCVCVRGSIRDIKDAIKALDTRMKEADMKYKFPIDFLASAFSVRWKRKCE